VSVLVLEALLEALLALSLLSVILGPAVAAVSEVSLGVVVVLVVVLITRIIILVRLFLLMVLQAAVVQE
jgi:hypothetical protein